MTMPRLEPAAELINKLQGIVNNCKKTIEEKDKIIADNEIYINHLISHLESFSTGLNEAAKWFLEDVQEHQKKGYTYKALISSDKATMCLNLVERIRLDPKNKRHE
jgi:hypothetical protein